MRLDHAHIFVNVFLYHDYQLLVSVSLLQPFHMRLNTSIFIFWIHKLSALLSSWRCFHLIVENILSSLLLAFSILDSWRYYKCLGMMSRYLFWCGISTSIWMSEWDCQNFWGIKTRWEFWGTNVKLDQLTHGTVLPAVCLFHQVLVYMPFCCNKP